MATQFSIQDNKPWKTRFFTIWSGQALSILGSQLVQFALIWYLTVQTSSATVLATATLVGMLPNVVLGPFIGTLVDRWNRRRIMIVADAVVAAAQAGSGARLDGGRYRDASAGTLDTVHTAISSAIPGMY